MSESVIKIEKLSKLYRIGAREAGYRTFRETLVDAAKAPLQRLGKLFGPASSRQPPTSNLIWALKDLSFEVKQGEVVGIIGRNGAGKSTLLKILSKITEPTEGRVELRGRVGSLLEVGTGFHPELTGHENIYLYGAILGMTRWEITRKFDEIVAFSELEKFIDTPVKRYSSGMYMRLAFAVAAHLEPEILLVDEVLAVGDAAFQKKCLGKMGEVSKAGRTVLFVSHNMVAIESLCSDCILLVEGRTHSSGFPKTVIGEYLKLIGSSGTGKIADRTDRQGSQRIRIIDMYCEGRTKQRGLPLQSGTDTEIVLAYESSSGEPIRNVSVSVPFYDYLNRHLFMCWTRIKGSDFELVPPAGRFRIRIPKLPLTAGKYWLNVYCEAGGEVSDWVQQALSVEVIEGDFFNTGSLPPSTHGGVLVEHSWALEGA